MFLPENQRFNGSTHSEFELRAEQFFGEYLSRRPGYRREQIEFFSALFEIFSSKAAFNELRVVSGSKRRVERMLGGQQIGIKGFDPNELSAAIAFEIASAFGEDLNQDQVLQIMTRFVGIEAAVYRFTYYYVAESGKMESAVYDYFDVDEIFSIIMNLFSQFIWGRWEIDSEKTIEENINWLYRKIASDLNHLPQIISRYFHSTQLEFGTYGEVGDDRDERGNGVEAIEMHSVNLSHQKSNENSWETLGNSLRQFGLEKLPLCLSVLPPREVFALLRKFGYLYPELTVQQFSDQFQLNPSTVDYYFSSGAQNLKTALQNFAETPVPESLKLSDYINQYQIPPFYSLNGKIVPLDSPRAALPEFINDLKLTSQLTTRELEIVGLASQTRPNSQYELLYTYQEIALLTELSESHVSHTLTRAGKILNSEERRFINTNGNEILPNSGHAQLIQLVEVTPQSQLAGLTEKFLQICLFITTPNPTTGRYQTIQSAVERFPRSDGNRLVRDMVKRIQETTIVDKLYAAVEIFLERCPPEELDSDYAKIARRIKQKIENGESVGGWHPNSLNIQIIAEGLNLNSSKVSKFLIKIGIYGKGKQEERDIKKVLI